MERSGLDGQSLPFADDSFDAGLSSWTLCTIPDAAAGGERFPRSRQLVPKYHQLDFDFQQFVA